MITTRNKIAFAMTMLASACLNNVFVCFYVEMFTEIAHVNTTWFMCTQLVFCIWNCSNDILFGWLSDRSSYGGFLPSGNVLSNVVKRRLFAIKIGGPLWVIAFLCVFWWPFTPSKAYPAQSGMWAMFVLLFYDGMLTYVEVNHSALLADMTSNSSERIEANMYSAICAAVGSLSSFFAHMFWTPENLQSFRHFCIIIGFVAILAFSVTVTNLDQNLDKSSKQKFTASIAPEEGSALMDESNYFDNKYNNKTPNDQTERIPQLEPEPETNKDKSISDGFRTFLSQLSTHHNFKLFCIINLLQVFDCTFEKNFLSSFLRQFAGNDLSMESQSVVVSLSFVLPWGCTVFLTPLVKRIGLHHALKKLFLFRIIFSIFGVMVGLSLRRTHWIFLLVNRVSSECVCRLIPLIIAQLSDEDIYLHQRERSSGSLRASIFGAANVVGKIGQSAGPMFGYFILMRHEKIEENTAMTNTSILIPVFIAAVPLFVVVSQFIIWNYFTLKGVRLKTVSDYVENENRKSKHTA
jgi:Na+/melibiose symporter-like transporter